MTKITSRVRPPAALGTLLLLMSGALLVADVAITRELAGDESPLAENSAATITNGSTEDSESTCAMSHTCDRSVAHHAAIVPLVARSAVARSAHSYRSPPDGSSLVYAPLSPSRDVSWSAPATYAGPSTAARATNAESAMSGSPTTIGAPELGRHDAALTNVANGSRAQSSRSVRAADYPIFPAATSVASRSTARPTTVAAPPAAGSVVTVAAPPAAATRTAMWGVAASVPPRTSAAFSRSEPNSGQHPSVQRSEVQRARFAVISMVKAQTPGIQWISAGAHKKGRDRLIVRVVAHTKRATFYEYDVLRRNGIGFAVELRKFRTVVRAQASTSEQHEPLLVRDPGP